MIWPAALMVRRPPDQPEGWPPSYDWAFGPGPVTTSGEDGEDGEKAMRAVCQRVSRASVTVDGEEYEGPTGHTHFG